MSNARELLFRIPRSDFRVETKRGSGPGGQHRNKTETSVRITHIPSGAVGEASDDRSQYTNKRAAMDRLRHSLTFRIWVQRKVQEVIEGKTIEQKVDATLVPENIVAEVKKDGIWVPWEDQQEDA